MVKASAVVFAAAIALSAAQTSVTVHNQLYGYVLGLAHIQYGPGLVCADQFCLLKSVTVNTVRMIRVAFPATEIEQRGRALNLPAEVMNFLRAGLFASYSSYQSFRVAVNVNARQAVLEEYVGVFITSAGTMHLQISHTKATGVLNPQIDWQVYGLCTDCWLTWLSKLSPAEQAATLQQFAKQFKNKVITERGFTPQELDRITLAMRVLSYRKMQQLMLASPPN